MKIDEGMPKGLMVQGSKLLIGAASTCPKSLYANHFQNNPRPTAQTRSHVAFNLGHSFHLIFYKICFRERSRRLKIQWKRTARK